METFKNKEEALSYVLENKLTWGSIWTETQEAEDFYFSKTKELFEKFDNKRAAEFLSVLLDGEEDIKVGKAFVDYSDHNFWLPHGGTFGDVLWKCNIPLTQEEINQFRNFLN